MIPLLWTSMILLAAFLTIYLRKSYKTEKENLKKEVGYLFINAVKNIEGGLLNQLIFKTDSFNQRLIPPKLMMGHDSVKVMTFVHQEEDRTSGKSRANMKVSIKKENQFLLNETEGVISMIIQMDADSTIRGDSDVHRWTGLQPSPDKLARGLKERFDINLQKAGLPVQYSLVQKTDTLQIGPKEADVAGAYLDIASGQKYEVKLKQYQWLLFKKMTPEIILVGLLFVCLGLAFYSMVKNIEREKQLMEAKSDFIQNMTHELKTPISTVSVALEALQEFDGTDDRKKREEFLDISKNELSRLSLLVDRVLSVSGMDKDLPPAHKENIDLSALVLHIIDSLKLQTEKQNISIAVHQDGGPVYLFADRQWVAGIIYNLLDNAIKYSQHETPKIDVCLSQARDQVELKISDNGPGIHRDHQTRVFEKFYRVPQGNVHNVKGHGLGLSYVMRVVKEMGGRVTLDSELGRGSVFNITLPA